jgi:hypothetical protein
MGYNYIIRKILRKKIKRATRMTTDKNVDELEKGNLIDQL